MIRTIDDLIDTLKGDLQHCRSVGDTRSAALLARVIAQAETVRLHLRWQEEDRTGQRSLL